MVTQTSVWMQDAPVKIHKIFFFFFQICTTTKRAWNFVVPYRCHDRQSDPKSSSEGEKKAQFIAKNWSRNKKRQLLNYRLRVGVRGGRCRGQSSNQEKPDSHSLSSPIGRICASPRWVRRGGKKGRKGEFASVISWARGAILPSFIFARVAWP